MSVNELIEDLRELVEMGYGEAKVYVRSEGFALIDMDADFREQTFDAVPCTGWDEATYTSGAGGIVVLGRDEPDDVMKRMVESGWWAYPSDCVEVEDENADGESPHDD